MPPVMRTVMSQAPGVGIECVQPNAKFYEGIKAGTIDLACFAFPVDTTDLVVKPICPADMVVVSRPTTRPSTSRSTWRPFSS